jgi:uracil-DNA glycosylase
MKQIFFLGQAPARPSSKHEVPGTYLHKWLRSIEFSDEEILKNCHFYALTADFPGATKGGHLEPTRAHIELHRPALIEAIQTIQPDVIVPVGKMAISEILHQQTSLDEVVGKTFQINPFDALPKSILCIPLSHPSGRSAWNHTHKSQVQQALKVLRDTTSL